MDLKDVLRSLINEMSFPEQQTVLKLLVSKMFENIDLSRRVESVFNDVANEYIRDYVKQEGTLNRVRDKVQEMLDSNLDDVLENLFEDDDSLKEDFADVLVEPVRRIVQDYFKGADVEEQIRSTVTKRLQEMVNDVEIDINF